MLGRSCLLYVLHHCLSPTAPSIIASPQRPEEFDAVVRSIGVKPVKLPPKSPNLNAFAERFVRSIKQECLDQIIVFGERMLRHVIREYLAHYHAERNHQGLDNTIPFPGEGVGRSTGTIRKNERLGGLLCHYHRGDSGDAVESKAA